MAGERSWWWLERGWREGLVVAGDRMERVWREARERSWWWLGRGWKERLVMA